MNKKDIIEIIIILVLIIVLGIVIGLYVNEYNSKDMKMPEGFPMEEDKTKGTSAEDGGGLRGTGF